jgi:hypothetical protein
MTQISFRPRLEGTMAVRTSGPMFIGALAHRVETGLLGAPARRWRYEVTTKDRDRVQFRARDWSTALNVGLNEVDVASASNGTVRYRISYMRWAGYVLALGAVIGLLLIAALTVSDLRAYLLRSPGLATLGLSPEQSLVLAWSMALFWGFVWPWILIALHKKPLRRLMQHLIDEVDAGAHRSA